MFLAFCRFALASKFHSSWFGSMIIFMSMKPSLSLKIGQQLRMTPQLQQAIKLLQLSTLDLQQEIQEALDSNVMLEEYDETLDSESQSAESESTATDNSLTAQDENENPSASESTSETEAAPNQDDGPEYEDASPEDFDPALDGDRISDASELLSEDTIAEDLPVDSVWEDVYDSLPTALSSQGTLEDDNSFDQRHSPQGSVQSHLLEQLNLINLSETDEVIALHIVDGLDHEGALTLTLEEILEAMPAESEVEIDEIEAVLHLIQHLDPLGIAARDLGECLTIQLKAITGDSSEKLLALNLIEAHLPSLANRDFAFLLKHLKVSEQELQGAISLIQSLDPKPGAKLAETAPQYVVPDVVVTKKSHRWVVELNPAINPKIRVNPEYSALVKRNDSSPDQAYLRDQMQEARWFIKSLQQRNDTLLRVATRIMEVQAGFLEHGDSAMKPLVLHDIAEYVELHESTISRVTTQKYIDTPLGIYELKYFFSSHVGTHSGGEISSTAIRAKIKQLIAQENTRKPLSDSKIAALLSEDNIDVARRTVAKYREALMIPPSNERKQLN
jgi:RNA polymerase sigma-54 factor